MFELSTKHGIEAAITAIGHAASAVQNDIQQVGLAVIAHIEKHGEVSLAVKLVNALPEGQRRDSLVQWFLSYSKAGLNKDKASKAQRPLVFDGEKETDIEGATATPWFKAKKAGNPYTDALDVQKEVKRLLKRIGDASAKGRSIVGADMIQAIRAAAKL